MKRSHLIRKTKKKSQKIRLDQKLDQSKSLQGMAEIIILMNANQELQDQEKLSMRAQEEHSTNHI